MNPPRRPPFYDIVDDADCPLGLQSGAIPEFVYFGEMIASKSVKEHSVCLQMCLALGSKCQAVNFFEPLTKDEKGFCELLSESQYDNPRLMRPFKKAIYYENIHCRRANDPETIPMQTTHHPEENAKKGGALAAASAPSRMETSSTRAHRIVSKPSPRPQQTKNKHINQTMSSSSDLLSEKTSSRHNATVSLPINDENEKRKIEAQEPLITETDVEEVTTTQEKTTPEPTTETKQQNSTKNAMLLFKKLAAKVREFNLRFSSR
jgi:hypothetical protein